MCAFETQDDVIIFHPMRVQPHEGSADRKAEVHLYKLVHHM